MTERLTLLTVHAHPDDEASKGAPTVARYADEGVYTVLVCCTGGEEGDLQNPTLRDEGQPFHGMTPEQERQLVADMRAEELFREHLTEAVQNLSSALASGDGSNAEEVTL